MIRHMRIYFNQNNSLPDFSVVDTVLNLRRHRIGMVQTKEQYFFCYKSVFSEYKRLKKQSGGDLSDSR